MLLVTNVLPTAAQARTYSGLGVESFLRWTSIQEVDPAAAVGPVTKLFGEVALSYGHANRISKALAQRAGRCFDSWSD